MENDRTVVLGERELAIGFRLVGLSHVVDVTPSNASQEFAKAMTDPTVALLIASESIRPQLSESDRHHADASLRPLVVFVPSPTGDYEVESLAALAKRVLGVSLAVPH